ncbi:hypothetical protein [Terricaulis silvestris]|nr:hypothetical protein [Terricaulis silvestris]
MAEREGGGSSWLAFLCGIVLVAIVAVGIVAYNGGMQPRETASLELNVPDVNINPPDVDLPEAPPIPVPEAETPAQ